MKRLICKLTCWSLAVLLLYSNNTQAQQVPQFTQYRFNQLPFNPAYTGSIKGINFEAAIRGQWLGINGAPLTQSFSIHAPSPLIKGGLGLSIVNDMLGVERNTSAFLSYAYKQNFGYKTRIAIGFQGGIVQKSLRGGDLLSPEGNYTTGIDHSDNLIPTGIVAALMPNFGLGLHVRRQQLELGLAVQNLLEPALSFSTNESEVVLQHNRNFLLNAAYTFELTRYLNVSPSLLVMSDLIQHQLAVNVLTTYDDFIIGGLTFRGYNGSTIDAAGFLLGVHLKDTWTITYSYDFPLSQLRTATSGSHEIVVHYNIANIMTVKRGKTRYNPRFM